MRRILPLVVFFLFVLLFLASFVVYETIHFKSPDLPETSLSGLSLKTYLYSIRKLPKATKETPVGISLSSSETSFLLERLDPKVGRLGFQLHDLYLKGKGDNISVDMIVKGPLGFYYPVTFTGVIELTSKPRTWTVKIHQLKIGTIPVASVLPESAHPDWPHEYEKENLELRNLHLDGKGLRVTVSRFELELDDLIE